MNALTSLEWNVSTLLASVEGDFVSLRGVRGHLMVRTNGLKRRGVLRRLLFTQADASVIP